MSQEESSSQALREEVLAKEQSVLELRTAMKEVRQDDPLTLFPHFSLVLVSVIIVCLSELCCCQLSVTAVSSEPGTDGAESDSSGADERYRAEGHFPGLLHPAASQCSTYSEASHRNCFLPK